MKFRLYTVSSIDEWIIVKQFGSNNMGPKLGKNGGPLCKTSGIIASHEECERFVARKRIEGVVSTSHIRKWKGHGR